MRVLVAVDGSECSFKAVERAARLPWPEGSVIKIISVAEIFLAAADWALPVAGSSYGEIERIIEEQCDTTVAEAMARFYELASPQTEVISKSLRGDPKAAILEEAEHWKADLIILGTHGYNAFERIWLGSVSRTVAAHAKCSVEIVRQREGKDAGGGAIKILLAIDGSEFGDAAVEEVAGRPWPSGTEVHLLSVVHLPFTPTPETWALPESFYDQQEKAERAQAESAVNRALSSLNNSNSQRTAPLKITSEIILGHPEDLIIERAKSWGADLVLVGSHGRRGFNRFLLGSVSQTVAYHAPCSVMIVRKFTPHESGGTQ